MRDSSYSITEVWLSSQEATALMGISRESLRKKRVKNEIVCRAAVENKQGGGFEYLLSSLPAEAKERYFNANKLQVFSPQSSVSNQEELTAYQPAEVDLYNDNQQNKNVVLSDKETQIHIAKNKIVDLYLEYQDKSTSKKLDAQSEFIKLYNLGLYEDLKNVVPEISRGSVERWKKLREEESENPFALAPKYSRQQRSEISVNQAKWLVAQYLNPNKRLITDIAEDAVKFFSNVEGEEPLHPATYRRFLQRWHRYNSDLVSYYREGGDKALNDNDLPFVTRDKSRVSVGSIIIADGHKLDFLVKDPNGKPKRMMLILFIDYYSNTPLGYEICSSENVKGISIALFRSILYLGKYPDVVYLDNGRAFAAKFFKGKEKQIDQQIGLYKTLGIKVITAWPYHGQSKTIEPFFRNVAALARRMPTYIGNRIELQPAYMHRGEKLHRRVHERIMEHVNIDLFTAYRAVEWQFNEYINTPQKGGFLKGEKPIDVFTAGKGEGIDRMSLMALMMKRENVMIKRCQFKIKDKEYQSEDLYGLSGEFEVRYDFIYNDFAYVFDPENGYKFIAAVPLKPKVHPAAFALGTEEDQRLLTERLEFRNNLRKATTTDARAILQDEIWQSTNKQLEDAKILQLNTEAEKNSTPEEQKKALKLKTGTDNVDVTFLKSDKNEIEEERSWI